jgi:curved DNA-binding protein CbpA
MPRVPRPLSGCDIKSLPLSPAEGFLFSRVDGRLCERDLALVTGLPLSTVVSALDRLAQLGAVDFAPAPVAGATRRSDRPPPRRSSAPPGRGEGVRVPSIPPLTVKAGDGASWAPPLYDPAELDEDVEIDPERRRRILDLFYRLDDRTYYELFGVGEHDEKKQIKSAYYALAPEFHPDKYFRKRLGSYKAKIEAIFARLTIAHDVLTSKARRAEYDEYLEQLHRNRAMSALLEQTARDVAQVNAAVDESAAAAAGVHASLGNAASRLVAGQPGTVALSGRYASEFPPGREGPSSVPAAGPSSSAGGASSSGAPFPPSSERAAAPSSRAPSSSGEIDAAPSSPRARREMLARKLRGGGAFRRGGQAAPASDRGPAAMQRAADSLRARYEVALADARRAQLQRYLDIGRSAIDRKDYAGGANAYRIAASLAPEDHKVQSTCEEAMRLAAAALADGYWKQAQYEEAQGRWSDAALSYSKACAGRPGDARAHERVAFATLKSSANTRRAVEFARKAVELEPSAADMRLTLALAYAANGFEKSALGEVDRARALAPSDARIREVWASLREQAQRGDK